MLCKEKTAQITKPKTAGHANPLGQTKPTQFSLPVKPYFSQPSPKKGRELQTALDTRMMDEGGGPLAKNQPEPVTGP